MKTKNNGFTLVETLFAISIGTAFMIPLIKSEIEESKEDNYKQFILESYNIIRAVDHRIATDGYDPVLWDKNEWNSNNEILEDLIQKDLTSKHLSNCSGGSWEPSLNSEFQTKLLPCKLWSNQNLDNIEIKGKLNIDSAGFIDSFKLNLNYPDDEVFKENFPNMKKAINLVERKVNQEIAGSHYINFVSTSSKTEISAMTCLNDFSDCELQVSLERNGGNEYLRADGSNSMIGEHITFIETKGQAPMKCIRWKNTLRDGTGTWTKEPIENCGIGIYKNDPHPVMVDVVADTGTFKNVVLDKECSVYSWDTTTNSVIDSGNTTPCGSIVNTGDVIQVVDNINASEMIVEELFINEIFSNSITSQYAKIENKLMTDIIEANNSSFISVDSPTTFKEIITMDKDLNVTGGINASLNIQSTRSIIANDHIISRNTLILLKEEDELTSCSDNGSLARTNDGTLLNCVNNVWKSAVKDSSPIGSIQLWASTTLPDGWIEMNGQSTSGYPDLRAIVGNNVPDMRGVVARGLDNGRNLDVGRVIGSYQEDTMQRIQGTFESRSHRARVNHLSGAFSDGGYLGRDDGWDGWVGSQRKVIFDTATQTRTSDETRMKNVALIYIIKAE